MLFWRLTLKGLFSGNLTYVLFFYLATLFVLCQWLDKPAVLRDVNVFQTEAVHRLGHAKYRPSSYSLDATREKGISNFPHENLSVKMIWLFQRSKNLQNGGQFSATVIMVSFFILSLFFLRARFTSNDQIFSWNGLICNSCAIKFHWYQWRRQRWRPSEQLCWYEGTSQGRGSSS